MKHYMRNNHITPDFSPDFSPEMAEKVEAFEERFWNFDWNNKENFGKNWVALIRESLEAGGLDFNDREMVERFTDMLEPKWAELGRQEKEISEQIRAVFKEAGANDVQLTWGMVENIPLTRNQKRKLDRLTRKMDEVHIEMLPVMGVAAALNEAREQFA